MRKKIIEKIVYKFEELSEKAQEKVLWKLADLNADYGWWDSVYDDAQNVGLKITEFDLYRNRHCKGYFIGSAVETAEKIVAEHGSVCETHKTATTYLKDRTELVKKYNGDNDDIIDNECDDLDSEFLRSILEDYSILLQKEYEYLTSKEAIMETIKLNEYEFDEHGNIA